MAREILNQDSIEVWYASCSDINEDTLNGAKQNILSSDERERMTRFRQPSDQLLYLTARLLLRSMLETYTGIAAEDWRFRFNEYGKPEPEAEFPAVKFNLSHSKNIAICVMHPDRDVGVDVEPLDRQIDSNTASSVLVGSEWESYSQCAEDQKSAVFIRYWVLKEAYMKAIGRGLYLPFSDFFIEFDKSGHPRVELTNGGQDQAGEWRFFEFQPDSGYSAAVVIHDQIGDALALNTRRFRPDVG